MTLSALFVVLAAVVASAQGQLLSNQPQQQLQPQQQQPQQLQPQQLQPQQLQPQQLQSQQLQPQQLQPQQLQPQQMQPQQLQPQQLQPQPQSQLLLPLPLSPQNNVLLQCRQVVPSTDYDVAELQRQILPISQSGQCLLACAAQRLGYMQLNYPLDQQGAAALTATLFQSRGFDPVFQNNLMITVNQCLNPQSQLANQYVALGAATLYNSAPQVQTPLGAFGLLGR